MSADLSLFLKKDWVENFFNENASKIFQENSEIKLIDLERAQTFDTRSYNILYTIEIADQKKYLRFSASKKHDVAKAYKTMNFLYEHGFSQGECQVPRPYIFLENLNAMIYENVPGETLMHELNQDKNKLSKKVKLAAQALKKIHQLPIPNFSLENSDWKASESTMAKFNPKLAQELGKIKKTIFDELETNKNPNFCHGDFQPNNLIINDEVLHIIDFGSASTTDKEIDLASFVTQLQIMLEKFGDSGNFEELKKVFLANYGDFNKAKYNLYLCIVSITLLEFILSFPDFENNRTKFSFVFKQVKDSLSNIGIKIEDAGS